MTSKIVQNAVQADGHLESAIPYFFWEEGETVALDGLFTLADLEAIIAHIRDQSTAAGTAANQKASIMPITVLPSLGRFLTLVAAGAAVNVIGFYRDRWLAKRNP